MGFVSFAHGQDSFDPEEFSWCQVRSEADVSFRLRCADEIEKLQHYYEQQADRPYLREQDLPLILAELPTAQPPTLSQRFWSWFAGIFNESDSQLPDWVEHLTLPESVGWAVFYSCLVLLVLCAIYIVANEIRQAARYRRTGEFAQSAAVPAAHQEARKLTLDEVRQAPLAEQPTLLLHLLLELMFARDGSSEHRSMTHREIVHRANQDSREGLLLTTSASTAERVTYGDWHPTPADMQALIGAAEAVLQGGVEHATNVDTGAAGGPDGAGR